MTQDVNAQLGTLQKMLSAYLRHEGLLQYVDGWAAGQNEGGVYVSLFNSRAGFRICNVYSEEFHKLPDFIQIRIPDQVGHEIGTERARVESKGYLIGCPLFAITRYKLNREDDKDKWRFGDVLFVARSAAHETPAPVAATPAPSSAPVATPHPAKRTRLQNRPDSFAGRDAAIAWAVAEGAYPTAAQAGEAYDRVKQANGPKDAPTMWQLWIGAVENQLYRIAQPA